jgi:CTP:molybdopterin cytidylyltransferase MocA
VPERPRLGIALLAAGSSRRFGKEDKLAQPFRRRMLGEHAAAAIPTDLASAAWVLTPPKEHPCDTAWRAEGFEPVRNPQAEQGMGTSVALAARLAMDASLDTLLIVLADVPLVPRSHFVALIEAGGAPDAIAVSSNGGARMPPVIFGSTHFESLARSTGDKGARDLLMRGTVVECPPEWLTDIDTPQALRALD